MMRYSVLASGSSGNASLLEIGGFGLLIDAGLGPRQLASRLASIGASWKNVNAVVLTHTHGDHWKERSLANLCSNRIPLYCHAEHHEVLDRSSDSFAALRRAGLVRSFERDQLLAFTPDLKCLPLELKHDSEPTFGFRIEASGGLFGTTWTLAYFADLGCWSQELVDAAVGADILALEFNHDEEMERASSRPVELIDRVLGDYGHLSNDQAGRFLKAVLERSTPGILQHVVQLHLSRECNRHYLAQAAARQVLNGNSENIGLHTARQDWAGPSLSLDLAPVRAPKISRPASRNRRVTTPRPSLPGLE
jgi:phosphoribosyl 1,2-cyclic phosphodiesterase